MARLGFGLASLASLGFLTWLVVIELNSPGLSFAAALIAMPMILALFFGLFKLRGNAIANDGRTAGWIAAFIALLAVGYMAAFFRSWLIVAIIWFTLYVPMMIGLVVSPKAEK